MNYNWSIRNTLTLLTFPEMLTYDAIRYIGEHEFSNEMFNDLELNKYFLLRISQHNNQFFMLKNTDWYQHTNVKVRINTDDTYMTYFVVKTLDDEILIERTLHVS
jgi:hypothetical protein